MPSRRIRRVQVGAVGREFAGGVGHISPRGRERAGDERLLVAVERLGQGDVLPFAGGGGKGGAVPRKHPHHVVGGDGRTGGQDRQPFDAVGEFPDVPRPGIGPQELDGSGVELHHPAQAGRLASREMRDQRRDVSPRSRSGGMCTGITFRRKSRSSRKSLGHRAGQVFVGRRDHTHVHGDRLLSADTLDDHAGLEDAEQLGLRLGAQVPNLVQEQRAPVGQLEAAQTPFSGAGEGALLVPEHLGFDQVLGDGGAVHRDEGPLGARALAMDGGRDQLLSVPDSPVISTRASVRRDPGDEAPQLVHGGAGAHQGVALSQGLPQTAILGQGPRQFDGAPDRDRHRPFRREGFSRN